MLAILSADPIAQSLLLMALIWSAAKIGGELAQRARLPAVVGELVIGVVLASLHRSFPVLPDVAHHPHADFLASLGVVVLMFAVGLESTVPEMIKVGFASLRVAVVGVVAPMAFGLLGARLLLPAGTPFAVELFIGACLCATSIGISAQVLREKNVMASQEGKVIVGAAVLDDVLGLLVLVVVTGLATASSGGGTMPWGKVGITLALATGFLAVALTLGRWLTPHFFSLASRLRGEQLLLPAAMGYAFLMAWIGNLAGLAPIVGAYAAGLILEPVHLEFLEARERHSLDTLVHPLLTVLAPVFFVVMGARVDLAALGEWRTLGLALALTVFAILGKYLTGYVAGKGLRSSWVGWGMVPRGEVGLIFVATGANLMSGGVPLLTPHVQAAVVAAIMLTTVAGPIGLGWVVGRGKKA
ncbi:MAG: cation:proton antiporter [Holophagaceae bacterium]|nr:cation:proton antiporter [Holophagaceae bacterium]